MVAEGRGWRGKPQRAQGDNAWQTFLSKKSSYFGILCLFFYFMIWRVVSFWAFKDPMVLVCLLLPPLLFLCSFFLQSPYITHNVLLIMQASTSYYHTIFNPFSCHLLCMLTAHLLRRKGNKSWMPHINLPDNSLVARFIFCSLRLTAMASWRVGSSPGLIIPGLLSSPEVRGGTQSFCGLLTLPPAKNPNALRIFLIK